MSFLAKIPLFMNTSCPHAHHASSGPSNNFDKETVTQICDTISHSLIIIGITIAICMLIYCGYKIWRHYILNPDKKSDKEQALSEEKIEKIVNNAIKNEVDSIKKAKEEYQKQLDRINEFIKNAEELRKQGLDISGKIKYDIFDIEISSKPAPNDSAHE